MPPPCRRPGWGTDRGQFFRDATRPANIQLEPSITITAGALDALGDNFEETTKGYVDFLLLNHKGFPFIILEAKAEDKDPKGGKEQARRHARSQNCRLVLLSIGNLHDLWDLERGNPYIITSFPTPDSAIHDEKALPDPNRLINEDVGLDDIAIPQRPTRASEPASSLAADANFTYPVHPCPPQ